MLASMKVLYGRIGGQFSVGNASTPTPGSSEVRVKVRAAAFNYVDQMLLAGTYDNVPGGPEGAGPYIAGLEYAGEVAEIGSNAQGWAVGDRVCGMAPGAFAEYVTAEASTLVPLPDEIAWCDAAALFIAISIANDALLKRGDFTSGDSILVTGGSSGVGSMAIQLAKVYGASTVLATTRSSEKGKRLRQLGADAVVVTGKDELESAVLEATEGKGVDLVIDTLGGEVLSSTVLATRIGGTIVSLGASAGNATAFNVLDLTVRLLSIRGSAFDSRPYEDRVAITASAAELFPRAVAGEIRPVIDSVHRFPHDAAAAIARLSAPDHVGKVVFEMV